MQRLISVFLVFTILGTWYVLPAWAQTADSLAVAKPAPTEAECEELGRSDGKSVATGGAFAVGMASGFALGPIGTAIAWAAQGAPEPPRSSLRDFKDTQCRLSYADAYREEGKSKKRRAALTGSLIGTGVLIIVAVAIGSAIGNAWNHSSYGVS